MVRFEFGLSIFGSLRIGSLQIRFELGHVISDMGHFGSWYNWGFVRLWIDLFRVFGSKSVHPILGVGSGMDPGRGFRISGLRSVLEGRVREFPVKNRIYREK